MPMSGQSAPTLPLRRAPRDSHPRSSAQIRGKHFFIGGLALRCASDFDPQRHRQRFSPVFTRLVADVRIKPLFLDT